MASIIKTDDSWRVCYFSWIRDVGNIKGIFILEMVTQFISDLWTK